MYKAEQIEGTSFSFVLHWQVMQTSLLLLFATDYIFSEQSLVDQEIAGNSFLKATPAEVVNTLTALIVQSAQKNKKLRRVNDMFYMVWKINVLL